MKRAGGPIGPRLVRTVVILLVILAVAVAVGLWCGSRTITLEALRTDPVARVLFFRLRLPRVVMAGLVGCSLAGAGAALQALFRNPL
ncbi:MAG TPA: iron chelate uptake ABC transporter family permease subunit, partial [Bryobacteraceae bacterium]|nr:iron chelate uptake ABC transporter family permease subunit [Bryobacteraceae bacterium]